MKLQKQELLGFFTHPGNLDDYLSLIKHSVESKNRYTVLYHNLHSIYAYLTSEELREYYKDTTVIIDGRTVVWLYMLSGIKLKADHRLTYVDFIMPMMTLARDRSYRVFHVGQQESVQHRALDTIRQKLPGVIVEGHHGYFDKTPNCEDSLRVIKLINDFSADIVLVGFGAPQQEKWVHAHRELINAPTLFTCGACMEYVAGEVRTPPRWMGKVGLEWSFRLIENPRRFAFRFLVEPFLLATLLIRNWISKRF